MTKRHCPGCHGHTYDELDGFDPCDEHACREGRAECLGFWPCPECERLRGALNDFRGNICSVCAGVPLASGRTCICGGKGTHDAEVVGLRLGYLDLERQLAEAQAHVRNHHLEPCVSCAANESERDALNAEVERLAEGRCIDHATVPAVDGCGVCVRERLATALSSTAGRELTAMRAALCAMLIWVNGEPHYRSSLGIPMELPSNVRRTVKLTLREIDFKPGKEPGK